MFFVSGPRGSEVQIPSPLTIRGSSCLLGRPRGKAFCRWNKTLAPLNRKRPFDMLVSRLSKQRGPARNRRSSEGLRESSLEELAQLGCGLELRNGFQILECRSEGVRKTPDRSWPEFLVLGLEVEVMHAPGKMFGSFKFALDKRLVDDHLGGDIRKFTSLPVFHLLSHGLEIPLHSVNTEGDAVDERERLRVFS